MTQVKDKPIITQEYYNIAGDWLRSVVKVREKHCPDNKREMMDQITRKFVKNLSEYGYDLNKINAPINYLNVNFKSQETIFKEE